MDAITGWLMEGDAAIRWQTRRDLLGEPREVWAAERECTLREGWGARLLALQQADGGWGGGVYSPKWTSTTYTLLTLFRIGLPPGVPALRRGAEQTVGALLGGQVDEPFQKRLKALDRCIVGMMLQAAVYGGLDTARIEAITANLLAEQMADGGWNCSRGRPQHSSFHTTLNVLDGLREYIEWQGAVRRADAQAAESRALELLLQHRLYKSDKTGEEIHPRFRLLSFPPQWHYDVLRGLEYFARAGAPRDPRAAEAVELLRSQRQPDGCWRIQYIYSGKYHFLIEGRGKPSRWNTLRALRILRWWEG
ncbi:MAG: prenyltransferase/squalene oxidase repeat-containing protein [Chloroflexota bacterium]|jgi:hypothetical protein